jgi:hypothetical protein
MKKITLFLALIVPLLSYSQLDSLHISSQKSGSSYLSEVLINRELNLGVFEIHFTKGRLSDSYFCVIDLKKKEILSEFRYKNWTYLYSSSIDSNAVLHLTKGSLFNRVKEIDLRLGNELTRSEKNSSKKDEQITKKDVYIGSQDLYCTSQMVYWNYLRIWYDETSRCIIIQSE